MKWRKKGLGAYFTVEASLVLPVVIGSIVFVICFLLFWYNRCLMEQDLATYAVKTAQSRAGNVEDVEKELRDWKKEYMTEKYYAWELEDLTMSIRHDWVELRRGGRLMMGERLWKADASCGTLRMHPASYLRICRRLNVSTKKKG